MTEDHTWESLSLGACLGKQLPPCPILELEVGANIVLDDTRREALLASLAGVLTFHPSTSCGLNDLFDVTNSPFTNFLHQLSAFIYLKDGIEGKGNTSMYASCPARKETFILTCIVEKRQSWAICRRNGAPRTLELVGLLQSGSGD